MPRLLCLVRNHAPYGSLQPAEAIRHAGGALGKGWEVVLAFMGDSVYTALPGQSPAQGSWVSLSDALQGVLGTGDGRIAVCVDRDALAERGLGPGDLIPGVQPASATDIATALVNADQTLVF